MPLPPVPLDLPPAVAHQTTAPQAVAPAEWMDQAVMAPMDWSNGVETVPDVPSIAEHGSALNIAPNTVLNIAPENSPIAPENSPIAPENSPVVDDAALAATPDVAENEVEIGGERGDIPGGEWSEEATHSQEESNDPVEMAIPAGMPPADSAETPPTEIPINPADDPSRPAEVSFIRVLADQQLLDVQRQVITARGDVLVQFGSDQVMAERMWINLNNRYLRAEGGVSVNRNQQALAGDTVTYNLLQGSGQITDARGSLRVSTLADDLSWSSAFPNDVVTETPNTLDFRLQGQGSISQVTSPGWLISSFIPPVATVGTDSPGTGRLRFEASQLSFDADGWYGNNLRLTNDPFSPPELELRGNRVSVVPRSENEEELCIENPRLVFDQGLSLPLVRPCYQFQNGQLPANFLNPLLISVGYDNRDRDGLFIDREFPALEVGTFQVSVAPQFYISRWLSESGGNLFDPANVGLVARARGNLGPRTLVTGLVNLPGLDLNNFADRVRANLRVQRLVGTHRLGVEYAYRERVFNGSLGFQNVQSSAGLLLESPAIPLGETGINLSYHLAGQYVTANTDRSTLLDPGEALGLASLFRFQGAVDLSRRFVLWQGDVKPSTATEGLRFSPRPLVPSLALVTGVRGATTYYSNSDSQSSLDARVQLVGQVGHLSRNAFDYTRINLGLSKGITGTDSSPFLFDRLVDRNVLSGGIVQQIYGPILLGVQTAFNLDTGQEIDTSFSLEYRRRTYGLVAQYSPTRETGFFGFRLSQFDWAGQTDPFDSDGANSTVQVQ